MRLNCYSISSVGSLFVCLISYPSLIAPRVMANTFGLDQLQVLIKRLTEAERRAKLLNNEVKHIRQEIATMKCELVSQQNRSENILGNTGNVRFSPPHLAPGTSRNEVDGPEEQEQPRARKRVKASFTKEEEYVVVFTDGACENNGRKNAKAGIGVWFGDDHPLNISKPVVGKATNNTAEIQACIEALNTLKDQGETRVKIMTDSQFTISCITEWIKNWKKNNWKTGAGGPVKNKEDLQKLDKIRNWFTDVKWCHVYGHKGIRGNEEADKLARKGALLYKPSH